MFKIGDKIVCHKRIKMQGSGEITTTMNKIYYISKLDYNNKLNEPRFSIINDQNETHWFLLSNYEKWFYSSAKIIRKEKLKKLNQI